MQIDPDRLARHLAAPQAAAAVGPARKRAAVLVPLLRHDGDWHLLFIRRAVIAGDVHSGQVAFPGGRAEPDEELSCAALREAAEEVALPAEQIRLLGELEDFVSVTGYQVRPVVGIIPWPFTIVCQPGEVDRVFTMPLTWLATASNCRRRAHNVRGIMRDVLYYDEYDGEQLWGLTAAITQALLQHLDSAAAIQYR